MKKFLPAFISFTLVSVFVAFDSKLIAQDIHFSQYYMSDLTLNPAMAGAFKDITATANYRSQWGSITTNPYKTMSAAIDGRFRTKTKKKAILAVGLNFYKDQEGDGDLSTLLVNLSVATHVKLDAHSIFSVGLNGGIGQQSMNFSNFTWDSQYVNGSYSSTNPSYEPVHSSSYIFPNFGAGVLYQYNKNEMYISGNDKLHADFGMSVDHINQPLESFYPASSNILYLRFAAVGNLLYGIKNTPLSIVPGFVYYRQGPTQEVQVGSMLKYTLREDSKYTGYVNGASVDVGLYYRWDDALVITGLIEMANYSIGLSYDATLSGLISPTTARGGFEISLRYVNPSNFLYQNKARF